MVCSLNWSKNDRLVQIKLEINMHENFDFFLYEKVKLFVIDSNFTELQHHSTDTKFANIETHTLILYTQYIFNC